MPHRAIPRGRRGIDRTVQLPEHGAELVDPQRDLARQLYDLEAVGARAIERRSHRRAAQGSRVTGRRVSGRPRRTRRGRSDLRSPEDRGCQLRRLDQGREDRVPARDVEPQAVFGARRRQKSSDCDARRRPGDDVEQRRRVDVGLRGSALHGRVGDDGGGED